MKLNLTVIILSASASCSCLAWVTEQKLLYMGLCFTNTPPDWQHNNSLPTLISQPIKDRKNVRTFKINILGTNRPAYDIGNNLWPDTVIISKHCGTVHLTKQILSFLSSGQTAIEMDGSGGHFRQDLHYAEWRVVLWSSHVGDLLPG